MSGKSWGFGSFGVSYSDGGNDNRDQGAHPPPPPAGPSCLGQGQYTFNDTSKGGANCCPGLTGGPSDYGGSGDSAPYHNLDCQGPPPPPPPPPPPAVGPAATVSLNPTAPNNSLSSSVQNQCNQNNGCNSGWNNLGTWQQTCASSSGGPFGDGAYSRRGAICGNPNPNSICPNIGTISSASWTTNGGIRLQCVYSHITNPFDPTAPGAFIGSTTSLAAPGGLQNQWCDTKLYADVAPGSACATFYTGVTHDYDYQQVLRIQNEHPDGNWVNDSGMLTVVQQVATGTTGLNSSPLGKQTAQNLIANYCLVKNPNGWADNQTLRSIINSWALQNAANIGNDCQLVAASIISNFCQGNSTSAHCDCFNATKFGTNIFAACQGNTSGACTDINSLAASFAQAPPIFAPQIATLKSYITPNCACGACVSATLNDTSIYLAPDTFNNLQCKSDIRLCLQSVKVGGSVAPGATINQNCSTTIGIGGTVPSPPPPPGAPPPPPSNQGFSNDQVVQANTNAPGGGTTALVSSPSSSTTSVSTTGTPSGGLSQTITSNAPIGIASSGGPVTYTPASTPAPAPAPAPTVDNTQTYELAAGGGIIGLSSSFFGFIVFCIILFLLFGGKKKAPRPAFIPPSAYGL